MVWNRPVLRSDKHELYQKHSLGTVSNTITGGLKPVLRDPNLALGLDAVHTLNYDLHQSHFITGCYILNQNYKTFTIITRPLNLSHDFCFMPILDLPSIGIYYLSSEQQKCWSDYADAQTDLHLCCSHMAKTGFLMMWLIQQLTIACCFSIVWSLNRRTRNSELTLQIKVSPSLTTHSTCMRLFQPVWAYTLLRNVWDRLALVRFLRTIRCEFSLQHRQPISPHNNLPITPKYSLIIYYCYITAYSSQSIHILNIAMHYHSFYTADDV